MVGKFWIMTLSLLLLAAAAGVHYLQADRDLQVQALQHLSAVTQQSGLSLGRAYYEREGALGNIAYPEMPPIDRMDFVYAQQ